MLITELSVSRTVMVNFMSTWLGCGGQLFGQTLVKMFL